MDYDIDVIRRINENVINADDTIKPFEKQLSEYYEHGYRYFNEQPPFVVLPNSASLLQAGAQNYPIIMDPDVLHKLEHKHHLSRDEIEQIPNWILEKNVLLLDSYAHPHTSLCMYLEETDCEGRALFAAFHLNNELTDTPVNKFASIYGRRNVKYTITTTLEKGLNLYPNEKTESWLMSYGVQLPTKVASFTQERITNHKDHNEPFTDIDIVDPWQIEEETSYTRNSMSLASRAQEHHKAKQALESTRNMNMYMADRKPQR